MPETAYDGESVDLTRALEAAMRSGTSMPRAGHTTFLVRECMSFSAAAPLDDKMLGQGVRVREGRHMLLRLLNAGPASGSHLRESAGRARRQ